ncbi:MAG: hypothetical protein HYT62_01705 [Candidatus Yanofskybacteria bacterium]|nr:hypothetical protein [Candidatus Yanofskybacteria bacterium]
METVEIIDYKEALKRIRILKTELLNKLAVLDKSKGESFWLSLYVLAICAQERLISSLNDELISSSIPWDMESNLPLISATIGDAVSYAERLRDPKDYLLKALLLSLSGWTLLSTEKRECACNKNKLQEISVDVLAQTNVQIMKISKEQPLGWPYIDVNFLIGVQSDNQDHLGHHYSFKEQSIRHQDLIIIFSSKGAMFRGASSREIIRYQKGVRQAEQFRTDKMAGILSGLVNSFNKAA